MWSRRSQIGMGLGSARGRHPNWSHPDHDACGTGFVTCLGGAPSYEIIQISLTALERLTHRGGVDADGASGDGAGLLTSLPQKFFRERTRELAIDLPEHFGVGCAFLPGSATAEFRAAIEIAADRSEEHTSELESHSDLVCRLLLEKKKNKQRYSTSHNQ